MPAATRSTLFANDVWNDMIGRVSSKGATIRLPGMKRRDMFRLRNQFYTYRKLLRKEGNIELADQADSVIVLVEPAIPKGSTYTGDYTMTFAPRASSPDIAMLAAALSQDKS